MNPQSSRRTRPQLHSGEVASTMYAPLACESALTLLERSISFGHGQLAVIRLAAAVTAGADPSQEQWRYCSDVVQDCADPALRRLFRQAAALSMQRRSTPM